MTYVLEIARFTVREGAEEHRLAERPAMVEAIRRSHPAHFDAYLSRADDDS